MIIVEDTTIAMATEVAVVESLDHPDADLLLPSTAILIIETTIDLVVPAVALHPIIDLVQDRLALLAVVVAVEWVVAGLDAMKVLQESHSWCAMSLPQRQARN